jgi:hypothetical protein
MTHRCRHCGHPIEIPQYFKTAPQRVFEFIWRHPGCTVKDIQLGVYGRLVTSNVVGMHMHRIREGLIGSDYRMTFVCLERPKTRSAYAQRKYFIEASIGKRARAKPTEGIADVAT